MKPPNARHAPNAGPYRALYLTALADASCQPVPCYKAGMTDGPIIDTPRTECRRIGETVRTMVARLPMWERALYLIIGLFFGGLAVGAFWLGATGQFGGGSTLFTLAVLALMGAVFIYGALRPGTGPAAPKKH
jgi:hypothetical protein